MEQKAKKAIAFVLRKGKGGVSILRKSVEFYFATDLPKFAFTHSSMCSQRVGMNQNHSCQFQWVLLAQLHHCVAYIMANFFKKKKDTENLGEKVPCITLLWAVIIPWMLTDISHCG